MNVKEIIPHFTDHIAWHIVKAKKGNSMWGDECFMALNTGIQWQHMGSQKTSWGK